MALILPRELDAVTGGIVNPASAMIVDDGVTVAKATPIQILNAATPLASQADAEAGTDNVKRMTPLRVAQAAVLPLAATTGAGLIGYGGSTVGGSLDLLPLTPQMYSAVGNGTTNDRTALAAADAAAFAAGRVLLISRPFRIGSNLTIQSPLFFLGGSLVIDAAVVVTLTGAISAPDAQIFTGSGTVAGLAEAEAAWFAGSLRGTSTSATALLQKAVNALVDRGTLHWRGRYANPTSLIELTRGQTVQGHGSAAVLWPGTTCNGFRLSGMERPAIQNIRFDLAAIDIIPASGVAVKMEAYGSHVEGCYSTHCYIGTQHTVQNQTVRDSQFNGSSFSANWIDGVPNIQIVGCDSSAFSDWFDLSSTAGFLAGESLSWPGPGGGTYGGAYGYTCSGTRCKVVVNDVLPSVGATITGGTSGASATLTARTIGNLGGGLRLTGNAAGCTFVSSSWAAGWQSLYMYAATDAHGSRPEYAQLSACYFDYAYIGASLDGGAAHSFNSTWINARQSSGLTVLRDTHSKFVGCTFSGSWECGVLLGAGSANATFSACVIEGANRANTGKSGFYASAGAINFGITGCRIGGYTAPGYGGAQTYPITVETGCSGHLIRSNRISGNTNNTILDGSGAVTKSVGDNI